ncbi:DUF2946 family protein [Sphingomonas sp. Root50]|uniref:DUF2946 family protein n=1 Tax=Sphingomonas sp. Root50 TaxID=1736551 RepID=UPI000A43EC11|nr:DUF2946 family protein [Sphingomonas sp. Root50]
MLAGALLALAVMMRMFVPAGFMPTFDHGRIVVSLCSGSGPMTMVTTTPGLEHGKPGESQHGGTEQPCAFSGLSAPSLAAADPVLLAIAILFVMALASRPTVPSGVGQRPHLRPPLRGPPATN